MAVFIPRFLRHLRDVDETGVADGDSLTYDLGTETWVPAAGGGGGGPPTGAAGGVLGGTYPNPGFAVDMATQAELDAHVTDITDAHDATAVSVAPFGTIAATQVQAALEEIVAEAVTDLGPAVILAPASSARNVIKPTSDEVEAFGVETFDETETVLSSWKTAAGKQLFSSQVLLAGEPYARFNVFADFAGGLENFYLSGDGMGYDHAGVNQWQLNSGIGGAHTFTLYSNLRNGVGNGGMAIYGDPVTGRWLFNDRPVGSFNDQTYAALVVHNDDPADVVLVAKALAGQTADIFQARLSDDSVPSGFKKAGHLFTKVVAAPADGDLVASEWALWGDDTSPRWKGKTSGGVVVNFTPVSETTFNDHSARHESGGADAIKLDDLAASDDNTDLDVSTTKHGLTPKLSNVATEYLSGTGVYSVPSGAGIPSTIVDAKGDLIAATAADTVARLAVGTNGHVLTADSAESTGIKWAAAAGGGAVATDAIWDTKGDLAAATGADAAVKVPAGANDTLLVADSAQTAGLKYAKLANAQVDAAAAIAYSKLNLAASVVTGDVVDGTLTTADLAWSPIYYAGLNGFLATNFDPKFCNINARPSTGYIYMAAVPVPRQITIANIIVAANAGGATLTAGQSLVGLYSSAGTLLGKSADQSVAWLSAGMPYTIPITVEGGQSLTQGGAGVVLYVAILSVGTTTPAFITDNLSSQNGHNIGLTAATFRGAYFSTGSQTSLPTSMTMTNRTTVHMYWAALS